jgi:2'-5' RNA ligase
MDVRCFVGVALSREIREGVGAALAPLARIDADAKWVDPANIHVTLKFLGSVPEGRIPEIERALSPLGAWQTRFDLGFRGAGAFPNEKRPRVLWIGAHEGAGALQALASAVEDATVALGFPPEDRPFSPHVTIARLRSPRGVLALMHEVRSLADRDFGKMLVDEFVLFRSDLGPSGPKYTPLRIIPLTA